MKKFLLFIVAVVGVFMAQAEPKVSVVKTDGAVIELLLSEFDSIRFEKLSSIESILSFELNAQRNGLIVSGVKRRLNGAVSIPSKASYKGEIWNVTGIGEKAFYHCEYMTSVEIPNSVTVIGGRAFEGCKAMRSVEIPNSVKEIG